MIGSRMRRSEPSHAGPKDRPSLRKTAIAAIIAALLSVMAFADIAASAAPPATSSAAGAPQTYSIWPDSTKLSQPADSDTRAVELGVRFESAIAGWVTAIRY